MKSSFFNDFVKIGFQNEVNLRTGSKAIVEFTFSFRSEFIEKGTNFFFRDGSTKGYGTVLEIL